ncbi:MAG: hypothetical protein QOC98_696, partial [Frankiaceae bacterium]|nr:hypothetical protein [Frankiaceae bacterium]
MTLLHDPAASVQQVEAEVSKAPERTPL